MLLGVSPSSMRITLVSECSSLFFHHRVGFRMWWISIVAAIVHQPERLFSVVPDTVGVGSCRCIGACVLFLLLPRAGPV